MVVEAIHDADGHWEVAGGKNPGRRMASRLHAFVSRLSFEAAHVVAARMVRLTMVVNLGINEFLLDEKSKSAANRGGRRNNHPNS
jgi:hypothetical protein